MNAMDKVTEDLADFQTVASELLHIAEKLDCDTAELEQGIGKLFKLLEVHSDHILELLNE